MSKNNKKKIIITGAGGFLGCNLIERLRNDEQYYVYALSSRPDELKDRFKASNIQWLEKNILFEKNAKKLLGNAFIVNCAFPRNSTGIEMADGLQYIQKIFEVSVDNKAEAIINISSQSVYSAHRTEPATEETPVCLETPYAVGKYATELMLETVSRGCKIKFTNLRMASLIGPGFNQRIVNRFALDMLAGQRITVVREKKRLGFLDIKDAVEAIYRILHYPITSWQPIYNIGNGKGYTVEEIYNAVSSVVLKKGGEIGFPIYEVGTDMSSSEVLAERFNSDFGFESVVTLEDSIEHIVDYILNNKDKQ